MWQLLDVAEGRGRENYSIDTKGVSRNGSTKKHGGVIRGLSTHFAMDLGTANTLIYMKGRASCSTSRPVVAIERNTGKLIAVGKEAKDFIGKTPQQMAAIRPMKDGVIADFDVTKAMIKYFLTVVRQKNRVARPKMVVGVPSGITQVEKKAVYDACIQVGINNIHLIEEPMAAAIGARSSHRPAPGQHGRRHRGRHD